MPRRKTIGNDPLDIYEETTGEESPAVQEQNGRPQKERMSTYIDSDLVNRAKNIVYWTPGLTLAQLTEEALRERVNELERSNGGAYQQRDTELRGGRPMK